VVHAPSHRGFKGTSHVLEAVGDLKAEGLSFEFRLVENMSHADAIGCYREADVVIDQLRIGWYGVLAVEALALGKPTIAYIRDDLWQQHQASLPLLNANPLTLKNVLRQAIVDRGLRNRLAAQARKYFDETHSSVSVARKLVELYSVKKKPSQLDGFVELMSYQTRLMSQTGNAYFRKRTTLDRLGALRELRRSEGNAVAWRHLRRRLTRQVASLLGRLRSTANRVKQ
jgi:hypothetical protein